MRSKPILFLVILSFLSLATLTISCRQHRTPKSISFRRISSTKNNQSDREQYKNIGKEDSNKPDSSSQIYIPALLPNNKEQILSRKAYVTSYNNKTKIPNWVAWHLTSDHVDGTIRRYNTYYEDEEVPVPRATNADYKDSGWSRGHMCPAGDNKWDETAMMESNLLTNMCPQHASLNSGLWNVIERDCRKWAVKYGDLYIVCGPILLNKEHETIGENQITVPEAFFKVILRLSPEPAAIGFIVRNNEGKKKKDQFVNTVDDVERITGMDFFPSLPDEIENEVEGYTNIKDW